MSWWLCNFVKYWRKPLNFMVCEWNLSTKISPWCISSPLPPNPNPISEYLIPIFQVRKLRFNKLQSINSHEMAKPETSEVWCFSSFTANRWDHKHNMAVTWWCLLLAKPSEILSSLLLTVALKGGARILAFKKRTRRLRPRNSALLREGGGPRLRLPKLWVSFLFHIQSSPCWLSLWSPMVILTGPNSQWDHQA